MATEQMADVLIVEDNPQDKELALLAWNRAKIGHLVITAADGADALDFVFGRNKYSQEKPGGRLKLILLDLKLPKISGLDVLKVLKEDDRTRDIPVIVFTSSAQERDLIEAYRLGASSYVVKPIKFEEFNRAIEDIAVYWLTRNLTPPR